MSEHTPTTEEVRNGYIRSKRSAWQKSYAKEDIEFDRWLEQVEAEAWKEGYVSGFLKAMGGELDGSAREAVRLLTGFTDAELDKLGGFEYCE